MKLLPILIICYIMTMVCCTAKHADNTSDTGQDVATTMETLTNASMSTDTSSIVKSDDECFIAFIKRFHTDTVFQQLRLSEVINGYNFGIDSTLYDCEMKSTESTSGNYIWDKDEINTYLKGFNWAVTDTTSPYSQTIELISDSIINETIYIPGSGTVYVLTFEMKRNMWYMTKLSDYWLN